MLKYNAMRYKKQRNLDYSETVRFHGHDGPFLALGYCLGRFLIKELKPKGIMGLRIRVKTRIEKPYTCLIDGLQCSTFATTGKGNMTVAGSAKKDIIVRVQNGRKVLQFKMSPLAWEICLHADDLEKAARRVLRTSIKALWYVQA